MDESNNERPGAMLNGISLPKINESVADSDTCSTYDHTPEDSDSGSSSANVGYFAMHGITAGPNDDFSSMFNRLVIQEGWSKTQRKKRRHEAIAGEIEGIYGTDNTKLEKWQELCRDVRIEPIPPSITKCKKALSKVHVNLVNLISHRHNPQIQLKLFSSYQTLREWTLGGKNGSRIFPKKLAKEEGFIKALLKDFRLR